MPLGLPSERWTPTLRMRTNVELDGFVGDDDVTCKFKTPRECLEYYARYRNAPEGIALLIEELDDLDERASIHGLVDERPGETSINGDAMQRGETLEHVSAAVRTGETATIREIEINGRTHPRVRSAA